MARRFVSCASHVLRSLSVSFFANGLLDLGVFLAGGFAADFLLVFIIKFYLDSLSIVGRNGLPFMRCVNQKFLYQLIAPRMCLLTEADMSEPSHFFDERGF